MKQEQMDDRANKVLIETINQYVSTADPVSSKTIAERLAEKLSPATIRHIMADLEDRGYLEQPHTSSGRVPTDKGYRHYVDKIPATRLDANRAVSHTLKGPFADQNMTSALNSICSELSDCSGQASLIRLPRFRNLRLKHIEFISIAPKKVLSVFLTEMGDLRNKVLDLAEPLSTEALTSISNFLNREFAGKSLNSIRKELLYRQKNEKANYDRLIKRASELWNKAAIDENETDQLLIEGLIHLFDQPEFSADLKKIKNLIETLEEKNRLIELLDLCMSDVGPHVFIGEERFDGALTGCSLITQNFSIDQEATGTLAIFGPKRMNYVKMLGIVNSTAYNVSNFLANR